MEKKPFYLFLQDGYFFIKIFYISLNILLQIPFTQLELLLQGLYNFRKLLLDHEQMFLLIILTITSMQIFIIIISTSNLYQLIMHVTLLSEGQLSIIKIILSQNDYFSKWDIIGLFILQNPRLFLYYKKFIIMQIISDLKQVQIASIIEFSVLKQLLIFGYTFSVVYLVPNRL